MNHLPWSEFFGPSLGAEFIVAFEPGNEIGCHTAIRFLVFFGEENVDQIFQNKKASLVRGFLRSGDWTRTSDLRVMSPTSYLLLYPAISDGKYTTLLNIFPN